MEKRIPLFGQVALSMAAGVVFVVLAGVASWWLLSLRPVAAPETGQRETPASGSSAMSAPDFLAVGADEAARLGIRTEAAVAASSVPLASIPAVVQPPANARVAVAAILPGVVLRTLVVDGDQVRKGQPLASVSSPEVLTLGADLARARARLGVARSNAARLGELAKGGIIAPARADEAEAALAEAEAELSEKQRILQLAGGDGASGTYVLTAPIAGRVTRATLAAGDPVDGGSAPYVIDAADRYEVAGQLPERLVGAVTPGMQVSLAAAGAEVLGRVTAVGSTIDPATRSASLKAEIPAAPGIISGRAASLSLFAPAPEGAVQVPLAALARIADRDLLFLPAAGGYAIREVRLGGVGGERAVLLSGLVAGERVVVEGTSALKALALSE